MLRAQDLLAHAMHADAREGLGDGRERADDVVVAGAPHFVQRPGRVLAARPRDQRFGLCIYAARFSTMPRALYALMRGGSGSSSCARQLTAAPAYLPAGGAEHAGVGSTPAPQPQRRIGGALARLPGAADRAPQRLVHRLAGEEQAVAHRLHQHLAPGLAAHRRGRERAERPRLGVPARRMGLADRLLDVGAEQARRASRSRSRSSRPRPACESSRAELAADLDHAERRARTRWRAARRCARRSPSRTPDRRCAAAADCPSARARRGRSCRARASRCASSWRFGSSGVNLILSAASTPVDTVTIAARALMRPRAVSISTKLRVDCMLRDRRRAAAPAGRRASFATSAPSPWRQNASTSRSSERAKSIAEISSRFLPQPNGPSTNSTDGAPVAEILRQRLRAGDVALAARRILDRAVRAHDRGEIVLHLAFARVAPADAQLLPRRRRIDVEPGAARRELRHRIDVRHVQPVRAAIVRHAEGAGVGDAAPADAVARLDQREAPARRRDLARRSNARRAGADDRDVDLARGRHRAERRRGGERRRAGEKDAPIECRHGFQIVVPRRNIARSAAFANVRGSRCCARAQHRPQYCVFVHRDA